ncbi:MAG: zinc ribbon domain-containing protein [Firmicutes bacterium]|nr:zinc ribbon domain-containing protein [Bacillota bacterium]
MGLLFSPTFNMSILGKFKEKVTKSLIDAGNRSKEALDIAGIKAQIWMLEKQKNHLLQELGREYYKLKLSGKTEETGLNFFVIQLRETDDEIKLNKDKIREIVDDAKSRITESFTHVPLQCRCGANLDDGTKYCGFCGENVENLMKEIKETGKNQSEKPSVFCGVCGTAKDNDDVFCSNCGAPLG